MKWRGREQSGNVEDRRGMGKGLLAGGGIIGIIVALITVFVSKDPSALVQLAQEQAAPPMNTEQKAAQEDQAEFTAVVLKDTEDVWDKLFPEYFRRTYTHPKLVLFSGSVQSACGGASSATGPFYCPADSKVYIDLTFFDDLKSRFKAPGDFACAYVIAHEIGHHVQNLLGTSGKVAGMRGRVSESEYNRMSVKLELQADFYAGVWAHHAQEMKSIIENGDIEEALNAANAIGDDRLQKEAQGYTVPDAFTHGTSEQRMRWFRKGYETGDVRQGDTFAARDL